MGKKEYNYEYEEGRIVRATEADIELNGEIVTSKVIVNTVKYYYVKEIELYYLQSRYYNPSIGRFIVADKVEILIQEEMILFANLMTYCLNEPVLRIDGFGTASGYIDNQNDSAWKSVAVGFGEM